MWNFLLLAVLTVDWSECALSLWKIHSRCSQILQRIIMPQQTTLTESASMELNQALLALRLWLLLIQQICGKSALSTVVGHMADRDQCERVLWNELWPSFERLLLFSITVAGYDEYQVRVNLTPIFTALTVDHVLDACRLGMAVVCGHPNLSSSFEEPYTLRVFFSHAPRSAKRSSDQ